MGLDEHLIGAIHVESLRHEDLKPEHIHHTLFQSSTITSLLDGVYDGDLTFGELAQHGDFGLGTLNALDGEMIALDGEFFRARIDGTITQISTDSKTPFAVVIEFESDESFDVGQLGKIDLLEKIDHSLNIEAPCYAIRIDGHFKYVKSRSVPRQTKPYRPLTEVVDEQNVFDLTDLDGTLVGFRFPHYASGVNVPGYHLHFIDSAHQRGGHVLDFEIEQGTVQIDYSTDLHMELPPGVDLPTSGDEDAIRRVEEND